MAYSPTELNQPPYVDPLHDPASETSPPYTPSPESLAAAEAAAAPKAKADPGATSYDYGPSGKTTV